MSTQEMLDALLEILPQVEAIRNALVDCPEYPDPTDWGLAYDALECLASLNKRIVERL